jgi:hypothetical protein
MTAVARSVEAEQRIPAVGKCAAEAQANVVLT